jgi:hypothetical protein
MAKGRNIRSRDDKKKKKPKKQALGDLAQEVHFRHHSVVTTPPQETPRSAE